MRHDGRPNDALRPIKITRGFTQTPAGSVLWEQGNTVVLCTASISYEVPLWFADHRAGGWTTCEYVMLPASTPQRKAWPKIGHTDSRGTEIQRLIGRTLRAVIDLSKIGPHTIAVDCQVLQADGGTRTASICGAYVALADAMAKLPAEIRPPRDKTGPMPERFNPAHYAPNHALLDQLAAVSVGVVEGEVRLDLDYQDDSRAEVDMNIACTAGGKFVEIQGTAEQVPFSRDELNALMGLAESGITELTALQKQALNG